MSPGWIRDKVPARTRQANQEKEKKKDPKDRRQAMLEGERESRAWLSPAGSRVSGQRER